ncbi:hypothetical protein BN874_520006 [Candidatus Contendobacter odensis Run_B_J11]|uniref:Uncharacterized protein n=1 Tax=Candidatus Contendobacter odensis Run_B_J11 TaxID=1400861 RepID=A0A7U7J4S6_9GAMM|nr:hypothetical protein BN874_520006 [Candidatus Contendobacter odensis Run_B_J11]
MDQKPPFFGTWITNFWNLDLEWMAVGSRKVEPSSSLQNWTMFYAPRQAIHGGSTLQRILLPKSDTVLACPASRSQPQRNYWALG